MLTIPRTASPACRLHSTTCILRLQGGRRCVRRGKAEMEYVLLCLLRRSAGQRKMVAHALSARLRTELYVVLYPDHCLLLKEVTECYAPAVQFDGVTYGRNNGAFL
jgi:hypothetical protein